MDAITRRSHRPSGLRAGIVIGLAFALLGVVVGTATGAVTQFQMVVIKNTASEPVPVTGTVDIGNTPANQDVTVSNFPTTQAVSGTVDIGNLPTTQPVSGTVDIGNFPAAGLLATKQWTVDLSTAPFGGSDSAGIQSMNVTDVIVVDGDGDNYDFGIGGFKLVANHEGNLIEHFTAAFPATGVGITCRNSIESCDVTVTVLGY